MAITEWPGERLDLKGREFTIHVLWSVLIRVNGHFLEIREQLFIKEPGNNKKFMLYV